ncbi:MAG: efflux RND transporter periplasmic adaptor subunit [Bacteroidaceae bacterium]|nr:efflux RND transporter periplasmic adaptor subunit [Bacteroidaceae bacterium]
MVIKKCFILGTALLILVGCSNKKTNTEIEPIAVKTLSVEPTTAAGNRSYVGTIEESYGSMLSFSNIGTVSQVLVDEGAKVKKNQALAVIDKTSTNNTYEIAKSALKQALDAYNRLSSLYKKGSLPEIKYVEIQTKLAQAQASEQIAKKALNDCVLRAPFAGYIAQRSVDAGNYVIPAMPCFKLVKINQIYVKLSIPEQEISKLKIGQAVSFTVSALDKKQFTGKIKEKGVQANPLSHTYPVKLVLNNSDYALLPGMVCSASINTNGQANTFIIPQEAVMLDNDGSHFVWLLQKSQATKRVVLTNEVNKQGVIVTAGLNNGDKVIIEGQDKVSEGTKIKES